MWYTENTAGRDKLTAIPERKRRRFSQSVDDQDNEPDTETDGGIGDVKVFAEILIIHFVETERCLICSGSGHG